MLEMLFLWLPHSVEQGIDSQLTDRPRNHSNASSRYICTNVDKEKFTSGFIKFINDFNLPLLFLALTSASFLIRTLTISRWPCHDATIKLVLPRKICISGFVQSFCKMISFIDRQIVIRELRSKKKNYTHYFSPSQLLPLYQF